MELTLLRVEASDSKCSGEGVGTARRGGIALAWSPDTTAARVTTRGDEQGTYVVRGGCGVRLRGWRGIIIVCAIYK